MTDNAHHSAASPLAQAAIVRPIVLDELSTVRFLHTFAVKRLAVSHLAEAELTAFCAYINSDVYVDRLVDHVRHGRLIGATIMDEIVATAGWTPANDSGATARLMAVFVSPLYAMSGLGRLVVESAEVAAGQAGFQVFTVRAPIGSTGFFARLGYEAASHGIWTLPNGQPIPVGFMRRVGPAIPRSSASWPQT